MNDKVELSREEIADREFRMARNDLPYSYDLSEAMIHNRSLVNTRLDVISKELTLVLLRKVLTSPLSDGVHVRGVNLSPYTVNLVRMSVIIDKYDYHGNLVDSPEVRFYTTLDDYSFSNEVLVGISNGTNIGDEVISDLINTLVLPKLKYTIDSEVGSVINEGISKGYTYITNYLGEKKAHISRPFTVTESK